MAEITSTIGKVGRPSVAPEQLQPQDAVEQVVASIPQAINPALEPAPEPDAVAAQLEQEKPPMPLPTLRSLIELGKIRDTITLGGLEFELETLDDDAQESLFRKLADLDSTGADTFVNLRRVVVAMSVVSVNGQPLDALDPSTPGDGFSKKLAIARRMQSQVVDRLYDFYNSLLEKSQEKIEPEQVKN